MRRNKRPLGPLALGSVSGRAETFLSLAFLASALVACGSAFEPQPSAAGNDAGGDSVDEPVIIVVTGDDASWAADSTTIDASRPDTGAGDAALDGQVGADSSEPADAPQTGCAALSCDGGCVPSDVHNCGACGHDCTGLEHVAGPVSCSASGMCAFAMSSCAPGWADCDGKPDNGCETSITLPANCGACGKACPSSAPVCSGAGNGAACVTGCPSNMPALCSGSCVDTTSSQANCGSCGHGCTIAVAHAQPTCSASQCGFACNSGYTACPTAAPSACVDTTSDPANCGTCGHGCPGVANGYSTCTAATCEFACNAGYTKSCDGSSCVPLPDPATGVFAAPGGATSGCGSQAVPCGTIAAALSAASAAGKAVVYLAPGVYSENVGIQSSITLQGGWTASWQPFCAGNPASAATIQGTSAGYAAVAVAAGPSALKTLTVQSKSTAASGESLYGVNVGTGVALTLEETIINVASAGNGQDGMTGANGPPAAATCSPGDGSAGTPGAGIQPGTGQSAGYSNIGYTPGIGGTGAPGGPGGNGASAGARTCVSNEYQCATRLSMCVHPPCPFLCECQPAQSCGTDGTNGCGGGGSAGGAGGTGAGSSVGIFAVGAQVTFSGVTITTGKGGNGGNGGAGGSAGQGTAGQPGSSGPWVYSSCKSGPNGVCQACVGGAQGAAGAAGGFGGNGGLGARGEGGSGGDSYCYAAALGATVNPQGLSCNPGVAGVGGNQGASNQGPSGHSGVHN